YRPIALFAGTKLQCIRYWGGGCVMRGVLFGFRGLCLGLLAVGSIVCGWAGNASAQAPRFVGPYIGVEGGVLFVPNTTFNGLFGTTPSMTFNTGFQGAVDVGYNFGAFAAEGEFSYRRANTDQLTVLGTPFAANGNVNAFSVMGNGLININ